MPHRNDLIWQDWFLTRIKRAGHATPAIIDQLAYVRGEIALERRRAGDRRGQNLAMKRAQRVSHEALKGA